MHEFGRFINHTRTVFSGAQIIEQYYVNAPHLFDISRLDPTVKQQIDSLHQTQISFTDSDRIALIKAAISAGSSDEARQVISTVLSLVESSSSAGVHRRLTKRDVPRQSLNDIFKGQCFNQIVDIIIREGDNHGLLIPVILAETQPGHLPDSIREYISTHEIHAPEGVDFKIEPYTGSWWICRAFNNRLDYSMEEGHVVDVNNSLLVKFDGKIAAYCYQTMTDESGETFIEGGIYAPISGPLLRQLKVTHDRGINKLNATRGTWALMRMYDNEDGVDPDRKLQLVRDFVQRMPNSFSGSQRERSRKRREMFEQQ